MTNNNKAQESANGMIGKILVVDDEPSLRSILVQSLNSQNYDAQAAGSGAEALEKLRGEDFDLLLSDLMMPEMDGLTLLQGALEIDPYLVAIMMTGQGTIQTAVDAMKRGAFDYVLKPFRLETMMPVLTRAINTRRLRLENVQLREAVAIHELSQTIAFTLDPQTLLSKLADTALQQSEADEVSVLLPTADGKELYVAAVRGAKRERLLGERVPFDKSISGWVGHELRPLILNGEVHDDRFKALWPRPEISSSISVPMQVANKLVGILNLNVVERRRRFTLGQMKALSILAGTAAAALESASLYAQVQIAEKNYRSIFENAVEGIFQSTPEGRFIAVNPAMARILGYDSPEELISAVTDMSRQVYVHPEDRAESVRREQAQDNFLRGFEFEAYRKDGEKIWLSLNRHSVRDENGEELYREGSVEDITERKRADEEKARLNLEIKNQEERLRSIIDTVPGVVWEAWGEPDAGTQRIDFVSDFVEAMLGYSVEEWLSTPNFWLTIVHPDDKEAAARCAAASFTSGKSETMEFRWLARDGHAVWVQSTWVVIKDDEGRSIGLRGVNTDTSERKRAEEELRFQKTLLESQSEASIDGILVVSGDSKILSFNQRFVELWGVSEMVLREGSDENALQSIVHKVKNPKEFLEGIEYLYNHPEENIQDEIQLNDGRTFDRYSAPIKSAEGEYYGRIWFFHDITERKHAENALRESEERYRDLVENAQDIIYSHDLQGNYTSSNSAGEEITGYSLEESLKLNLQQTIAPEYLEKAREMLARKLAGEDITAYEMELIAKDGHRVPIEVNTRLVMQDGIPVGVNGIARDITERKAAEAELRRLAAAVEQTADSIVITDPRGTIEYVNPAFERITGYSRQEALGQNPRILKSRQNDPAIYQDLWKTILGGGVWTGQLVNRKKDGTEFNERVTISAVHDEAGKIVNFIAVKQDTTAQVKLEEQLRQSQKLEAIGQLAGGVAHDFNNLLTVIGGYSSILLSKLPPDSPYLSSVEEIKKAGDRAGALTRQLLAFSRKQILQPKILDLNAVVTDLGKMVRRLIGEDIDLLTKTSSAVGKVRADPGQLEQVLINLIVNARDAMPTGGKLTIQTSNVTLSRELAHRHDLQPGAYVMLAVSDNGCGMDAALQARIFDPFFTTKASGKGTGLGLATVYGIVKQSGGNISVYSEPGKGTTFKIYLPRVDQDAETAEGEAELQVIPSGSETVLIVEDEDQVRAILKQVLEDQGYQVLAAANGAEALAISENLDLAINLMITDVVMPHMSGRELAERMKELRPDLPVLFMSGYTDDAMVHHGLLDEKLNFIQKPFDSAGVARKVREVLDTQPEILTN